MITPALEQEIIDACTAMEMARESAKSGDSAMLVTSMKDVRKRASRILKALDVTMLAAATDPQLPTSPPLPIRTEACD